jgi:PAS domain S-box-containing protein
MLWALMEHMPDLIFVLDTNLHYMLNNAAHRRQLGVQTLEEVVGKTPFDFFPKEEAELFIQEERKVIGTGQPSLNFQTRYVDPAGQERWAITNRVPFRNSQGSVIGLVGVVHDITDLKQAEAILRQTYNRSEQRLSVQNMELAHAYSRLWYQANLLENVSEAIVATDMNGVIQSWNHAAEICYGRKAEEAIGQNWKILREHLVEEQTRALNDSLAAGRAWQGELSFRHKNGQSLYLMVSVSFIHDYYENEHSGIVAVSRDITERKKVEAAEREQRLFAEALRDTAAAINSTLELNEVLDRIFLHITRIVPCDMANVSLVIDGMSQVVRYWGAPDKHAEEEISTTHFEVAQTPTLKTMMETQQPMFVPDTDHFQGWVRRGTVNIRSYMGVPIIIQGEVIGFLNVSSFQPYRFEAIHIERMKAFAEQVAIAMRNAQLYETIRNHAAELVQHVAYRTAELERERRQLQIILDSMSDGVVSSILNDMGALKPVYVNPALNHLLGYDLQDWHDQMVMTQIMAEPDNPSLYYQVFEAIATRGHWHGEATLRRKDGSEFRAFVSSSRVNNQEGLFIGVVTVIRDISQEKALQEQRSRFVANASHELRTPLTNLMTRLWLLRKQPERLDEHLVILEEVANRMRYLVEDLLDVSRLERGTIPLDTQDMDLRDVVESVVQLQQAEAEQKQIRLESRLPNTPLVIRGDHRRIHQIITNLVINAINYTPSGGHVDVEASIKPDADSQTSYVIIGIRDSGVGIPPEHLEHLFQPFYRIGEQGKGTGLGLAIAREIARMHGGDIFVESEVGKGSCFNIRFTLRNPPLVSGDNP